MKSLPVLFLLLLFVFPAISQSILIPMDDTQRNHLKAYGAAFEAVKESGYVEWLLNYKGGSFLLTQSDDNESICIEKEVSYEILSASQKDVLEAEIRKSDGKMDKIMVSHPPKIAVYSPSNKQPWDDAVTLALSYAEIPYELIYDEEVVKDDLSRFDWLHLHHEDFTGQYGKFYRAFRNMKWYQEMQQSQEEMAANLGFNKVSQLKLEVTRKIKSFVEEGGFLFAMCSATDTYDIALAAANTDICEAMYDGDPAQVQTELDFSQTLAFTNFKVEKNPWEYEFSNIDIDVKTRSVNELEDVFSLQSFDAQSQPVLAMLTQNHVREIKGFMGQTTAFRKSFIRPEVIILGENPILDEAKYIHSNLGRGFWTFYGGHDPEDFRHNVGEAATDLSMHPNSPGYRLILNNILFSSAQLSDISKAVNVYPNPASSELFIEVNFPLKGKLTITLKNNEGKQVWQQEVEKDESTNSQKIDLGKIPKGMYILEISQGNRKAVKKLMKE